MLRRFIFLMALLTLGGFLFWTLVPGYFDRPPGNYETETGTLRLEDGLYAEALAHFDKALEEQKNHRGALMGRALVFIQTQRYEKAQAELEHLIDFLSDNLAEDDETGRGVLAAAYANRGIVLDRTERYEEALASYVQALNTDAGAVEGPGIIDKILHNSDDFSTVRKRAIYLQKQLKLPESERVLRIPKLDARQRMHKP
ncbi:tetratricopeptide repeat protein [Pelagibius sp. Alg239-R121]|uniref:tetratricopeptide repeat protein n=1 Tax=Pelagibius sp. Alg239-R121 TaxID=2993448 RepID=UPI0024A64B62|nr:tetratricopeptide repeat protein [Pelagibius sp. Alg239-R121]